MNKKTTIGKLFLTAAALSMTLTTSAAPKQNANKKICASLSVKMQKAGTHSTTTSLSFQVIPSVPVAVSEIHISWEAKTAAIIS